MFAIYKGSLPVSTNNTGSTGPSNASSSSSSSTGAAVIAPVAATVTDVNNVSSVFLVGGDSGLANTASAVPVPTGPYVSPNNVASVLKGVNTYAGYFTDVVVNIDNSTNYYQGGMDVNNVSNGVDYKFPGLGALVEAARGNLESPGAAKAAGVNLTNMSLGAGDPQAGYYAAYLAAAQYALQPMNAVENSVIGFIDTLATVSNVHFGLMTFNDYVCDPTTYNGVPSQYMAPPTGTPPYILSSQYPYAAMTPAGNFATTSQFSVPSIPLDPSGNTTQNTIINTLPALDVWGNRNCAAVIQAAVDELTANNSGTPTYARQATNKAIILVTVGPPTVDLNDNSGTGALSDAMAQAALAKAAGIPIYCVSVSQTTTDGAAEDTAYGDGTNASAVGIAGTAGYGGKYYRVDWTNSTDSQNALTSIFANIARVLVSVVH